MHEQCWSWGYEHFTGAMITLLKKKNQLVPVQLIPKPEILYKKGTSWTGTTWVWNELCFFSGVIIASVEGDHSPSEVFIASWSTLFIHFMKRMIHDQLSHLRLWVLIMINDHNLWTMTWTLIMYEKCWSCIKYYTFIIIINTTVTPIVMIVRWWDGYDSEGALYHCSRPQPYPVLFPSPHLRIFASIC